MNFKPYLINKYLHALLLSFNTYYIHLATKLTPPEIFLLFVFNRQEYLLIMQYADSGNLHKYLQNYQISLSNCKISAWRKYIKEKLKLLILALQKVWKLIQ